MEEYFTFAQAACMNIIDACEIGLRVAPGTISNMCKPTASELRMLYYPAVNLQNLNKGTLKRAWPHTDLGIITLLFQDDIGGLELEDRSKPFTFVPVVTKKRNEMVINISDTFGRWTNGKIPPGVHQVNVPPNFINATEGIVPERYSSAFFFKSHRKASVGPLAPFVGPDNPAQYPDITSLEFHCQKLGSITME